MVLAYSFVIKVVHNVVDAVSNRDRDTSRATAGVLISYRWCETCGTTNKGHVVAPFNGRGPLAMNLGHRLEEVVLFFKYVQAGP